MERLDRVRAEQEAFDQRLDEMLKEHAGEFVVFQGGEPVAFFATYDDAYAEALNRFGVDGSFLVSEVKKHSTEPVSLSWDLGLMFDEA